MATLKSFRSICVCSGTAKCNLSLMPKLFEVPVSCLQTKLSEIFYLLLLHSMVARYSGRVAVGLSWRVSFPIFDVFKFIFKVIVLRFSCARQGLK